MRSELHGSDICTQTTYPWTQMGVRTWVSTACQLPLQGSTTVHELCLWPLGIMKIMESATPIINAKLCENNSHPPTHPPTPHAPARPLFLTMYQYWSYLYLCSRWFANTCTALKRFHLCGTHAPSMQCEVLYSAVQRTVTVLIKILPGLHYS